MRTYLHRCKGGMAQSRLPSNSRLSLWMTKLSLIYNRCSPFTKTWRNLEALISLATWKTATPLESITTLDIFLSLHFLVEEADLT